MGYPAFWRNGKKTVRAVIVLREGDFYYVRDAKTHREFSVVPNEITTYLPMNTRVTNL